MVFKVGSLAPVRGAIGRDTLQDLYPRPNSQVGSRLEATARRCGPGSTFETSAVAIRMTSTALPCRGAGRASRRPVAVGIWREVPMSKVPIVVGFDVTEILMLTASAALVYAI